MIFTYLMYALGAMLVVYILMTLRNTADAEMGGTLDMFVSSDDDDDVRVEVEDPYVKTYTEEGRQVLILYGTEYGFAEELAKKLCDRIAAVASDETGQAPLQPRVVNMKHVPEIVELGQERAVFCVCSTTGDGVFPEDAEEFYAALATTAVDHLAYSVLALGDTGYPHFCKSGKLLDERLGERGAEMVVPRRDIDQEDWGRIDAWMDEVVAVVPTLGLETRMDYILSLKVDESGFSRKQPYMSELRMKKDATVVEDESDNHVIHCEFDLSESGLEYRAGDAVGIYPRNFTDEVDWFLDLVGATGTETVDVPAAAYSPKDARGTLRPVLTSYYDLKTVRASLLQAIRGHVNDSDGARVDALLAAGTTLSANAELKEYIESHEVGDVFVDFSSAAATPLADVLSNLRVLQPRYYSISSSPVVDDNTLCVTAAIVRYELHGRPRTGVCTTFLCDRVNVGENVPIFISKNNDFRLPEDQTLPILMIGPGTGIAPFRAFLQERTASGATGTNTLYFGCRHKDKDFLYRTELERHVENGDLRLRTAFSRDQRKKIYVQHLLADDAADVWRLVEAGGHIYVCGDGERMAPDVHAVLLDIFASEGGLSEDEAEAYMANLEASSRYQRDVWIT